MKVFVIMTNDYPAGVLDDEQVASDLCDKHNEDERARARARNRPIGRIHWTYYEFEVGDTGPLLAFNKNRQEITL